MKPVQVKWLPMAAVCLFMFVPGCAGKLHPLPSGADWISDPSVLLSRIVERKQRIRTVSTVGRIDSRSKAGLLRGRITTLVSRDRQVRLEAWTPSWDLAGSFVGNADTFIYFQRGDKYCVAGTSDLETIDKVLPLGIDIDQYVNSLLGSCFIPENVSWKIEFDRRCGCWLLSGSPGDGSTHRIRADADGTVRQSTVSAGSKTLIDIRFKGISTVSSDAGSERFPAEITFDIPGRKSKATLKFKETEINGEVSDDDWEQTCPEGLGRMYLR
ncbi:MAG TPA: DUF4292 domain-containing protein [Myxococcota bacterium]|nr:DUF4292 domain-containing protein [Myxococcota bacterium]HPV03304.1 DUF4292 domain-containing protein [Myxococcota bacterium]